MIKFNQNAWLTKELFSIRTKLSYYKVFQRTSINNGNVKNRNAYE